MRNSLCPSSPWLQAVAALLLVLPSCNWVGASETPESTFLATALGFLGISATPGNLKDAESVRAGELWVAHLVAGARYAIADDASYRSPVFLYGDKKVLALRGDDVVEISVFGGVRTKRASVPGAVKLVGAHRSDPNQVLLLLDDGEGVKAGVLNIDTDQVMTLHHDADPDGRRLMPHLSRSERVYGEKRLLVRENRGKVKGRFAKWTDVYYQEAKGVVPREISRCKPASCSEPSLSFDQTRIVYVKSAN